MCGLLNSPSIQTLEPGERLSPGTKVLDPPIGTGIRGVDQAVSHRC